MGQDRLLMVLASQTYFRHIYNAAQEPRLNCSNAMARIGAVAFDHK